MIETWTPYLSLWAFSAASLGWLYSALAHFWPRLFHRELIRRAYRQEDGYRFGRSLFWQLPKRQAVVVGLASLVALPAVAWLPPFMAGAVLLLMTLALLALWLTHPPGQRLGIVELPVDGRTPTFALLPDNRLLRSMVVLVFCGVIPAVLLGWVWQMGWRQLVG